MRKSTSVQPRPEKMLQTLEHVFGTALSWHTILPTAVSAVIVIIGWFVVHTAQNNRERRKQIREYVNGLYANLTELETLAIGYHTSAREESKEAEIISKLGRLEKACFNTLPRFKSQRWLLRAIDPKKLKINGGHMQALRQAITLEHFDSEHNGAFKYQDEFIWKLRSAAEKASDDLETVRINALD